MTSEQYAKSQDRASLVGAVIGEAESLTDRAEIHKRLQRIKAVESEVAELKSYRGKLEDELQQAESQHQQQAAKIQGKLATATDVEKKLALRERLSQINAELQSKADSIGRRLAAIDDEVNDAFLTTCTRPSLERRLLETGPPELLLQLRVAKSTQAWCKSREKQSNAALAEHDSAIEFADSKRRRHEEEFGWLPERLWPAPEKPLVKPQPVDDHHAYLRAEAAEAARLASEASLAVAELERRIKAE